jgi:hypothetical protein
MAGQFPTDPNFRSISFTSNSPTLINQTLSGRRQARQIGSQYFSFTVQMPPLQQEKAQQIFAFLNKQKGSFDTFTIKAPLDNLGVGKDETDIEVQFGYPVSSGTGNIDLVGFTASTSDVLKAGDLIQFADHNKVYMVRTATDSDGLGHTTVNITPTLVSSVASNEAVTVNRPAFEVYLESNDIMYTTDASGFYNISFDVREVIT